MIVQQIRFDEDEEITFQKIEEQSNYLKEIYHKSFKDNFPCPIDIDKMELGVSQIQARSLINKFCNTFTIPREIAIGQYLGKIAGLDVYVIQTKPEETNK
jgi:hypothetical protein